MEITLDVEESFREENGAGMGIGITLPMNVIEEVCPHKSVYGVGRSRLAWLAMQERSLQLRKRSSVKRSCRRRLKK